MEDSETDVTARSASTRKIEIVRAAVGYSLPREAFSGKQLAAVLGVTAATFSRKKNETGSARMLAQDWSRIFDHAKLAGYGLTYHILLGTPEDLETALVEAGVGIHGDATQDRHLQRLLDLSTGADPKIRTGTLSIERKTSARRGGIGGHTEAAASEVLHDGDFVKLHLTCPDKGTLVVLNSGPKRDLTWLVPSLFHPRTDATGRAQFLPSSEDYAYFPVEPPAGEYRLFAIWFAKRPRLGLLGRNHVSVDPATAQDLNEVMEALWAAEPMQAMVAARDYVVSGY